MTKNSLPRDELFLWGYIEGFDDTDESLFYGRIGRPDDNGNLIQETWSFELSMVDPADNPYLQLGSIFKWYYNDHLRPLEFYKETWTKEQIEAAFKRADELTAYFENIRNDK